MTIEELKKEVSASLGPARLAHTLSVEAETARFGELFDCGAARTEKLRAAALLHDITKEIDAEGQFALCRQYGIQCTPADRMTPQILHAVTGAAVAADRFGEIADEEVCRMIASHTTGRAGMTTEEILLFLADYIEPTRRYDDCRVLRARFYDALPGTAEGRLRRLYEVTVAVLDNTVLHLIRAGSAISPRAMEARNDLLLRLSEMK